MPKQITENKGMQSGAVVLTFYTLLLVYEYFSSYPDKGARVIFEVLINAPLIYGLLFGYRVTAVIALIISLVTSAVIFWMKGFSTGDIAHFVIATGFWLYVIRESNRDKSDGGTLI